MPNKLPILPGQRFGRWTVLELGRYLTHGSKRRPAAECQCDCGTIRIVRLNQMRGGTSLSCGCLRNELTAARGRVRENIEPMLRASRPPSDELKAQNAARVRSAEWRQFMAGVNTTHGLSRHPLYPTWNRMRQRCENPGTKDYPRYGGRGVTVCAEWRDVTAFITWIEANIGPRPEGRTLDRIDNDGHYEPGNVRWATAKEQSANRGRKAAMFSERLAG